MVIGNLIPPDKQTTKVKSRKSRKVLVKEGKNKEHERFMKQNLKMIALSAGISLCFACSLTFLFVYMAPAALNYVQNGILEVMAYLRGPGDKSMITAVEVDQGIPKKWVPITMNLTREYFYSTYYQNEVVVFPGRILYYEAARNEAFKLARRGSGKKVTVHEFVAGMKKEPHSKSLNDFRKMKTSRIDSVRSKTGSSNVDNMYMEEGSQLLAKSIGGEKGSDAITLDLGGHYKFTTVHNGTGPPFRQSRHRLYEALEGSTKWLLFHPNALPTIGYSHTDHYTSWMHEVYPGVSPLFSPLQLTLHPGRVLYVPEGYYYTYTAESALASMVLQEAPLEDAGTELYCLSEGAKRVAVSDFPGAAKLFNMGLELKDVSGKGQGRYSHQLLMSLGRVHEALGILESAETAYRDAISQNARHVSAYTHYMNVVMLVYEEKKRLAATSRLEVTPATAAGAGGDARSRNQNAGIAPECTANAFVEARNEARYKVRNAAVLAQTSSVLTEALSNMNVTFVTAVNKDRDLACSSTSEL